MDKGPYLLEWDLSLVFLGYRGVVETGVFAIRLGTEQSLKQRLRRLHGHQFRRNWLRIANSACAEIAVINAGVTNVRGDGTELSRKCGE